MMAKMKTGSLLSEDVEDTEPSYAVSSFRGEFWN